MVNWSPSHIIAAVLCGLSAAGGSYMLYRHFSQRQPVVVMPLQTSYLYAPGLFGSPIVIGRYCRHFVAPTEEVIIGTQGSIFGDGTTITAVTFAEIITHEQRGWFRTAVAPAVIKRFFQDKFGITVENYNKATDGSIMNYRIDLSKANIAQEEDCARVRDAYAQHVVQFPCTNIVLFGDSRGAATLFRFLALDKPLVACAILEGIFDTIPHLTRHCWRWSWKGQGVADFLSKLVSFCAREYRKTGPFPADHIDEFPHTTPTLLVTSVTDEIVPFECTVRLYRMLRQRGHTNVRLLILPKSGHDSYMTGPDKTTYENCVHAFYQSCGIAHDPEKAAAGARTFAATAVTDTDLLRYKALGMDCCIL